MRAAALVVELRLPGCRTLKEKRAVLRPTIEGLRRLASISVAEVGRQDDWQRVTLGVAVVASDGKAMGSILDAVRRYLETRPEAEVVEVSVTDLEVER